MADLSLCLVFNKSRTGVAAREQLDIGLMAAAFGQTVTLVFLGDGVYQLLAEQQPDAIGAWDHSKIYAGLDLYDIDELVVESESLAARSLAESDLSARVLVEPASVIKTRLKNNRVIIL